MESTLSRLWITRAARSQGAHEQLSRYDGGAAWGRPQARRRKERLGLSFEDF